MPARTIRSLRLENQAINEYQVTFNNGEMVEIAAWTPEIAQAIAEEEVADVPAERTIAMNLSDHLIHDLVTATLSELGLPAPDTIIQTMLMEDHHYIGYKFRYDGGYAIFRMGSNAIEFYDDDGELLKTIGTEAEGGTAA